VASSQDFDQQCCSNHMGAACWAVVLSGVLCSSMAQAGERLQRATRASMMAHNSLQFISNAEAHHYHHHHHQQQQQQQQWQHQT
jgi:hypothetical protein